MKIESSNENCVELNLLVFVNFCGFKDWEIILILILNFSVFLKYVGF